MIETHICGYCGAEVPVELLDFATVAETYDTVWLCKENCVARWAHRRWKEGLS